MEIKELKKEFGKKVILDYDYPKPYPEKIEDPSKIKAIVLGCDPSNFSDNGKTRALEYVFGIVGKGEKSGYFDKIEENLNIVGLTIKDIYVQNLCRNYFNEITSKNLIWEEAANLWVKSLKNELNSLNIPEPTPVLLTAGELLRFLVYKEKQKKEFKDYYNSSVHVPLAKEDNLLNRPLIPFFRGGHGYYYLSKWPDYAKHITQILKKTADER